MQYLLMYYFIHDFLLKKIKSEFFDQFQGVEVVHINIFNPSQVSKMEGRGQ